MAEEGCLSPATIEALAQGVDPDGPARAHLDSCAACRAAIEEVREINGFLARFAPGGAPAAAGAPDKPLPPDLVPGYEILEEIHRGGQGIVYRALQSQTRRTVAIKMLLAGSGASARQRERFERELRIAAALRHPNIVTVYDGGYVAGGRYAFAMELIDGLRLDRWSRALDRLPGREPRRRALRERLRVMAKVCDAVLCAHQNAVVHRDLKPANILVDASGEPHVLDFGIARSLEPEDGTRLTHTGEFAGTLAYASPEQVSGDPRRVGTPTDIYSLGVIMYQLVSGRMPYSVDGPISQAVRNIESAEPAPLLGRTADPNAPFVDGEVATIILKALSKDPARRYQTAAGLRDDISRYLAGDPIEARRDSTWYVVRKSVSRHRFAVGAAALLFLLVAGFGAAMAWQARRIGVERDTASGERDRATAVTDFVVGSLISQDPNQQGDQDMTVTAAMGQALEGLRRGDLGDQPETEALLLRTIAEILNGNGRSDEAEAPAAQALEIEERLHPADHPHIADGLSGLANVLESLGRAPEAEPLYARALKVRRRLFKGDHPDLAASLNGLAGIRSQLGNSESAEALYVEALDMNRRLFQGDHPYIASAMNNLAFERQSLGRWEEARTLYEQALDMTRRLYPGDHPEVADGLNNLAYALQLLDLPEEAEVKFVQALDMHRRLFKGDHPSVADGLNNLAHVRFALGQTADAESLFVQALDMNRRLYAGDHPGVADNLNNLAYVRQSLGMAAEAELQYTEALGMYRRLFGDDHPDVASCLANHARCLADLGRNQEALDEAREAAAIARRTLAEDHPTRQKCDEVLAELEEETDQTGDPTLPAEAPGG